MVYKIHKKFYKKAFTLTEKTIEIEQQDKFGVDYKVEFNLAPFQLPHGTSRSFVNEFSLPVVVIGFLVFVSAFFFANGFTDFDKFMMIGLMITGVVAMGVSGLLRKKQNNAIYYNEDNAYIFEISEEGNSEEDFGSFVKELDSRIKMAKDCTER